MDKFANMTVEDYINMFYRRKWWIIIPCILSVAVAFYLKETLPKIYIANTLVLVESQKVPKAYIESTVTTEIERRLSTIQEQVMSRTRLYEIMEQYNLYADLREKKSVDELVAAMRKSIKINLRRQDAFAIYFQGKDPEVVANVANALTQQFIDANLNIRQNQARETAAFLEERLDDQEKVLKKTEQGLANFTRQHYGKLPENVNQNLKSITQINMQISNDQEALKEIKEAIRLFDQEIEELESISNDVHEEKSTSDILVKKLNILQEELALLKLSYQDSHPKMQKLYANIRSLKTLLSDKKSPGIKESAKNKKNKKWGKMLRKLEIELLNISSDVREKALMLAELQKLSREEKKNLTSEEKKWTSTAGDDYVFVSEKLRKLRESVDNIAVKIFTQKDKHKNLKQRKESLEQRIALLKKSEQINLERSVSQEEVQKDTSFSPKEEKKLKELKYQKKSNTELAKSIRENISRLKEKIKLYSKYIDDAPKLDVQMKDLTRKYDQDLKQFQELLGKTIDADLARELESRKKGEQFIIVDKAIPPTVPIKPKGKQILLLCLIIAGGFGTGMVFLMEFFNQTFTTPKQLEKTINIPVLASIPHVVLSDSLQNGKKGSSKQKKGLFTRKKRSKNSGSLFNSDYKDILSIMGRILPPLAQECYRVANVKIEQKTKKSDSSTIMLVTSTIPQEGKSTTTTCLAWTLSKGLGKKVLIIDCDFYKPRIDSYLGISYQDGICEYLRGNANLQDILLSPIPNKLSIIPSGKLFERSEELLSSSRMKDLLDALRGEFDYILIDIPSIMATVYEANSLTPMVDHILFIVREGYADQDLVIQAISLLNRDKLLGILFNDTSIIKQASYERYVEYKKSESIYLSTDKKQQNKRDQQPKSVLRVQMSPIVKKRVRNNILSSLTNEALDDSSLNVVEAKQGMMAHSKVLVNSKRKQNKGSYLRIVVDDKEGIPYAQKKYNLIIDGISYNGKTDSFGLVNQKIPDDAKEGELSVQINDDSSEVLIWPISISQS